MSASAPIADHCYD